MKTFYGSTFIDKEKLEEAQIDHPIKLEYYKIINEDDIISKENAKFGIDIIKTEYLNNEPKIEEKKIKYISNDENIVNKVLEILKCNEVTPISVQDVLVDFSKQIWCI